MSSHGRIVALRMCEAALPHVIYPRPESVIVAAFAPVSVVPWQHPPVLTIPAYRCESPVDVSQLAKLARHRPEHGPVR